MKLSIIIPVLNGENYLQGTLNSLMSQTYDAFEVLVVDGGSTDQSLEIIKKMTVLDNRIKLIKYPGSSIYEAIIEGFNHSVGDILSWLNADDLYMPWTLKTAQMWLSRPGVEWITGLPSIWDREGSLRCVYPHIFRPRIFINKGFFNPRFLGAIQAESTFFSRRLYEKLSKEQIDNILATKFAGDFCLWKHLAAYDKLHAVPTVLGGFRIHGANLSILKLDSYLAEVKSAGALCLSPSLAYVIQTFYGSLLNPLSYRKASIENKKLNVSLGL